MFGLRSKRQAQRDDFPDDDGVSEGLARLEKSRDRLWLAYVAAGGLFYVVAPASMTGGQMYLALIVGLVGHVVHLHLYNLRIEMLLVERRLRRRLAHLRQKGHLPE